MFQETGAVTRFPSVVSPERPQASIQREERAPPGEIFAVLWRRRIWIALGTVAGLIAAGAVPSPGAPRHNPGAQIPIDSNHFRGVGKSVASSKPASGATTAQLESQTPGGAPPQ